MLIKTVSKEVIKNEGEVPNDLAFSGVKLLLILSIKGTVEAYRHDVGVIRSVVMHCDGFENVR